MATAPTAPGTGSFAAGQGAGSAWPAFLAGFGLVVLFGLLAWVLRVPLGAGFQKVWPVAVAPAETPAALPDSLRARPVQEAPKPRVWTVSEVSAAITTLPGEIYALVREGEQELRQLEDPGNLVDPVRQQRARSFFQAWGRTFGNRLKLLEKKMPPDAACAPFSSLVAGCRAVNIALDGLRRAPNMTTTGAARKTLEQTAKDLQTALAPPAPPQE